MSAWKAKPAMPPIRPVAQHSRVRFAATFCQYAIRRASGVVRGGRLVSMFLCFLFCEACEVVGLCCGVFDAAACAGWHAGEVVEGVVSSLNLASMKDHPRRDGYCATKKVALFCCLAAVRERASKRGNFHSIA